MHEYSIVQALLDQCEAQAKIHDVTTISKVTIKIGKLSGVEPHLLYEAFDAFKKETICEEATLQMNIQNIVIVCKECLKETILDDYAICCPHCQSTQVSIIDGKDMYLMSLELEN
jgi:hydrogenase nickel incorporation protein HypA/HybF